MTTMSILTVFRILRADFLKQILSIIAESEPQSAYSASVAGFRGELTYFMRTPLLGKLLKTLEMLSVLTLFQQ